MANAFFFLIQANPAVAERNKVFNTINQLQTRREKPVTNCKKKKKGKKEKLNNYSVQTISIRFCDIYIIYVSIFISAKCCSPCCAPLFDWVVQLLMLPVRFYRWILGKDQDETN